MFELQAASRQQANQSFPNYLLKRFCRDFVTRTEALQPDSCWLNGCN